MAFIDFGMGESWTGCAYYEGVPTAIVFSAGGMFAAWEIGVWQVLREHLRPDIVVGASAGAWNGWAIAGGATPADLARDWMDPCTASIMRLGLHRSGCMRPDAMHAKARELFDHYQPRVPFGLTLVEAPRLRIRLVRDGEITWQHLAAACSIPLAFPPVRIDGKRYVDGGLLGALPLWAAEEIGATRVIAVNCLTTWPFRLMRVLFRPRRPSPKLNVVRIEPSRPLGTLRDAVFWKASNIERWIDQGAEDANRALSSVRM
jgi:predicted acylesterase/phospholipase RssA